MPTSSKPQVIVPITEDHVRIPFFRTTSLKSLLSHEQCPTSENGFDDKEKVVPLDQIQALIAQRDKTAPRSSVDALMCSACGKVLKLVLLDAKFGCKNVKQITKTDFDDKLRESKDAISTDIAFHQYSYLLFKSSVLTQANLHRLRQQFSNKPSYRFVTAREFRKEFEKQP